MEVPCVRYLIGRIVKTYDDINQTLPLSIYKVCRSHSPLSLLCITMILRVCRKFFEITVFPNNSDIGMVPKKFGYFLEYREVTDTPRGVVGP